MYKQQEWLVRIFAAQPLPKSAAGHVLGGSLGKKASSREGKDIQTSYTFLSFSKKFSIRISKSSQAISDAQTQLC